MAGVAPIDDAYRVSGCRAVLQEEQSSKASHPSLPEHLLFNHGSQIARHRGGLILRNAPTAYAFGFLARQPGIGKQRQILTEKRNEP
jgi:hypothetical protein